VCEIALLGRTGKQMGFHRPTRSFPVSGKWLTKLYSNDNTSNTTTTTTNNNSNKTFQSNRSTMFI